MAIGLTEEHEALAASIRGFAERHVSPQVVRSALETQEERPAFWPALAGQGLLGLHLPEAQDGQGFSLLELAIAVEESGRALMPGPYVPTVLASAIIAAAGKGPAELSAKLLTDLADGSRMAAVGLHTGLTGRRTAQGFTVDGTVRPVLGAALADLFVLPVATGEGEKWVVVDAADTAIAPLESLDLTRSVSEVSVDGVLIPGERVLAGVEDPRGIAAVILGAEACGVAGWALDAAVSYAKMREQFSRPIGQFQGVKHLCAWMLAGLERARAAVWDAARSRHEAAEQRAYATAVAAAVAPEAAVRCAEDCIQVHGGIGYTWEHDAHLYYRRALTLRALIGRTSMYEDIVAGLAFDGVRRPMDVELPEDAEPVRAAIRSRVEELAAMEPLTQRTAMADEGWVTPHLPKPWGRNATPVEQIVIQQELRRANVSPISLMIGTWVVPSLVQYGTREQQERFLPPTLRGELVWCQLFSEPCAGSDLAGLTTRADKAVGVVGPGAVGRSHGGKDSHGGENSGWRITGQKIWTSLARDAQWGICVARTNPDAPKHKGITYFLVDMAADGIEIRPLRECTGEAVFNEVFLDGVFVPDSMVVGPVDQGWQVARNTLANERVGLTTSFQLGGGMPQLVELARELGMTADPLVRANIGRLACDEHALQLLGLRATLKQLSGTDPGATANVRKLIAMEHGQDVTEYGVSLLGPDAALWGGSADSQRRWSHYALACRAMTIGGGTTQINLNVIGERILGLPRDP